MVFVVYGTTAEYIKLMPILLELKQRDSVYTIALSQHEEQLQAFFKTYPNLPKPDLWLVHGFRNKDLDRFYQAPIWAIKVVRDAILSWGTVKKRADKDKSRNIWLVHGDTFTTVFGAVWGRLLGYKVGHVEAGLRSFNMWHPFPEEADRLAVTRLARVHFAPGDIPVANLVKAKGDIVNTYVNTSYDSITYATNIDASTGIPELPARYGIISLHRTEFVANKEVFERTLKTLAEYGSKMPLIFLKQPVTVERAKDLGMGELLEKSFFFVPKLDYFSFIKLLHGSEFVVTDSGGLQEDCTYMGKPCLIIRKATERQEGLAEGITKLSYYDDKVLRLFMENPKADVLGSVKPERSPNQIIIDYIVEHGYAPAV